MFARLHRPLKDPLIRTLRQFVTSNSMRNTEELSTTTPTSQPSERMKQFHEKLKLQPLPRVKPCPRFVELVLVDVDPRSGDLLPNTETDPTRWGDWQTRGRVTDF